MGDTVHAWSSALGGEHGVTGIRILHSAVVEGWVCCLHYQPTGFLGYRGCDVRAINHGNRYRR